MAIKKLTVFSISSTKDLSHMYMVLLRRMRHHHHTIFSAPDIPFVLILIRHAFVIGVTSSFRTVYTSVNGICFLILVHLYFGSFTLSLSPLPLFSHLHMISISFTQLLSVFSLDLVFFSLYNVHFDSQSDSIMRPHFDMSIW